MGAAGQHSLPPWRPYIDRRTPGIGVVPADDAVREPVAADPDPGILLVMLKAPVIEALTHVMPVASNPGQASEPAVEVKVTEPAVACHTDSSLPFKLNRCAVTLVVAVGPLSEPVTVDGGVAPPEAQPPRIRKRVGLLGSLNAMT